MSATLRTRSPGEFGNLADTSQGSIQVANYFNTNDGASSPILSPQAYTSTIQTLTVPKGAVQVVLFPSTDLRISESSAATGGNLNQYDIIPAGTKETIPCAQLASIAFQQDSANGNLRFKFIFV